MAGECHRYSSVTESAKADAYRCRSQPFRNCATRKTPGPETGGFSMPRRRRREHMAMLPDDRDSTPHWPLLSEQYCSRHVFLGGDQQAERLRVLGIGSIGDGRCQTINEHHVGIRQINRLSSARQHQVWTTQWHQKNSRRATIRRMHGPSVAIRNVTDFQCGGLAWRLHY